ncbi:condensation domain-containing protein [Herbidospora cretacea]|uniref:condensation domain-containing protein n=1 Tax=Herbidospora cretacea TaxID=28444 RepID=UPI00077426E8|nr:condensation domain-containing protein [Herbidospora cretacea]
MKAEFAGGREGSARLAWGQRAIWDAIQQAGPANAHFFNIGRLIAFARGRGPFPIEDAVGAVAAMVLRHEALRAKTHVDAGGEPYQVVHGEGRLPVRVAECADDEADEVAEVLLAELARTAFSPDDEWPARFGLIVVDGMVRHVVFVLCHLAADDYAADLVARELRNLLLRGGFPAPPSQQLLDLVAEEESGVGRYRSEAALAHWENGYRRIPPTMFPAVVGPPAEPRWSRAVLESRALEDAVAVVAARHHVSTGTVLMTAVSTLLGALQGHDVCAITPIVHNRYRPATRDLVATLTQLGLFTLDIDPLAPLAKTLEQSHSDAMRSYRHAQYDQRAWDAMVEKVSAERDVRVYPSCCFNDVRPVEQRVALSAIDGDPGPAEVEWLPGVEHFNCDFCFVVTRQAGTLAIGLTADTCRFPRERMVTLMRGVEELVVESAFRDTRPMDLEVLR